MQMQRLSEISGHCPSGATIPAKRRKPENENIESALHKNPNQLFETMSTNSEVQLESCLSQESASQSNDTMPSDFSASTENCQVDVVQPSDANLKTTQSSSSIESSAQLEPPSDNATAASALNETTLASVVDAFLSNATMPSDFSASTENCQVDVVQPSDANLKTTQSSSSIESSAQLEPPSDNATAASALNETTLASVVDAFLSNATMPSDFSASTENCQVDVVQPSFPSFDTTMQSFHPIDSLLLQSCIKMTNEPPGGLSENLRVAYAPFETKFFENCSKGGELRSMVRR